MNTTTTLSIVLKHIIPALQAVQRDLVEAEREAATRKAPEPPKAEPAPKETSGSKTRLLKPLEAAEFLGMSSFSFYRLVSGKQIPHYRIGSRILISQEQLSTWLASNESVSGSPSPLRHTQELKSCVLLHLQDSLLSRAMNTTTLSIVLKHVIPALQAVQRELLDAERVVPSREPPAPQREPAPQGKPLKRFYKLAEAAKLLNLSKATLYKMTMTRRIPSL